MSRSIDDKLAGLSLEERRVLLAELLSKEVSKPHTAPLSFAQQRLWFLAQLEPQNPFYNVGQALRFEGPLNVKALARTLNMIVARHESLRTRFQAVKGEPVQVISNAATIDLVVSDVQGVDQALRELEARRLAIAEMRRPFDLARDLPVRATLVRIQDNDHLLVMIIHHIASDGWSMGILARELSTIYEAEVQQKPHSLPELPIQYSDFAQWQRDWLQGQVLEDQLTYWREQLNDAQTFLNLPTDYQRPSIQSLRGANVSRTFSGQLRKSLNELSQSEGVTLFMTLLAAFQTLLLRYSGEDDIVVGSPIAGRNQLETEGLIGFFINSLPLRTDLSRDPPFRQLLRRVKEVALGAYAHQDLPFEKLVEELNPQRSLSHTPLFQVMFALQNAPRGAISLRDLTITRMSIDSGTAKCDLSLFMTEVGNGLSCLLEYNVDLFEERTAASLLHHFEILLKGIVADPDQRLSRLPLLSEAERYQLLKDWNESQTDFRGKSIHQLFEEQVERTPNAPAVVFNGRQLSYTEINAWSNRVAHGLQKMGLGPDKRVGISMDRSAEMIVAVLGVLKAGGAYVPLDPRYPSERLQFMADDAQCQLLLTDKEGAERLPETISAKVCLDNSFSRFAQESSNNLVSESDAENLAYVIYTSGSTGQPKGVAMPHLALMNLISWQLAGALSAGAITLQFASLSFDVSFQEIFSTLCSGGTLVLISNELQREAPALLKSLNNEAVERVFMPFAYLQHLAEVFQLERTLPGKLRDIITAGEQLEMTPQLTRFCKALVGGRLFNHYGPTETHVVTAHELSGMPNEWPILPPIGRPIANTQIYILDRNLLPTPIGVPGELCVGGANLARGYLNRPDLTAEKFRPNAFSDEPGSRIYLTGDLARYLKDGNIELLGRIDQQVKIRGFRVEPGEIETALAAHAGVREVVVVVREDIKGDRRLVAYVVPRKSDEGLARDLRTFLKQRLPDFMIPTDFVITDYLPLTPSGKVDRRALPAVDRKTSETEYVAPRSPVEEKLVHVWSEILRREPIGIRDNFFELGGHSMLAVRLMAEIEKHFGQRLPLASLFQGATIEYLGSLLREGGSISWPTVIEIQPGLTKTPLFCVSTPNVNALGYRSLARYLDSEQPVYGLQAQYPEDLDGEHSWDAVDDLATQYLPELLAVQPNGPYQLAGMCRGAHIAFEMARRLEQQGAHVAFLGILDTWVMENTYNQFLYVKDYYRRLKARLRSARFRDNLAFFSGKARSTITNLNPAKPSPSRPGKNERNPLQIYFPGADFVPKTFNGRISVFRARRQPLDRIRDKALAWGRLAKGGVDVHFVPGSHGTVLKEPFVRGLAEEIKTCLLKDPTP